MICVKGVRDSDKWNRDKAHTYNLFFQLRKEDVQKDQNCALNKVEEIGKFVLGKWNSETKIQDETLQI